jgi:hypothetical protein
MLHPGVAQAMLEFISSSVSIGQRLKAHTVLTPSTVMS